MSLPLTPTQNRQIDYLHHIEAREELTDCRRFDFICRDCKVSHTFSAASTGIQHVREHAGHHTWIDNYGKGSAK